MRSMLLETIVRDLQSLVSDRIPSLQVRAHLEVVTEVDVGFALFSQRKLLLRLGDVFHVLLALLLLALHLHTAATTSTRQSPEQVNTVAAAAGQYRGSSSSTRCYGMHAGAHPETDVQKRGVPARPGNVQKRRAWFSSVPMCYGTHVGTHPETDIQRRGAPGF